MEDYTPSKKTTPVEGENCISTGRLKLFRALVGAVTAAVSDRLFRREVKGVGTARPASPTPEEPEEFRRYDIEDLLLP